MMPNMDGYELVRSLRDAGDSIPVLMVTAKDAFDDMRMGFLSGTDDYMIKPVNINELVLRVGALLRRAQMINERKQRIGDTILECDSLTVSTSSENMVLPQKEFMLLYKMVSFPGKIFTRQQLMDDIWGPDSDSGDATVSVHINRLRNRFPILLYFLRCFRPRSPNRHFRRRYRILRLRRIHLRNRLLPRFRHKSESPGANLRCIPHDSQHNSHKKLQIFLLSLLRQHMKHHLHQQSINDFLPA